MNPTLPFYRPRKGPRLHPEADLQGAVCDLLRLLSARGLIWFAVPNEGKRSLRTAAAMKRRGLRAGVGDLCVITMDGHAHFLELKAAAGRQSEEQIAFAAECALNGTPYQISKTLSEAAAILFAWGAIRENPTATSVPLTRRAA